MQIIIFSFNRSMQLSALIGSIIKQWRGGGFCIEVIYNSSDAEFEKGYSLLKERMSVHENIHFYKEKVTAHTQWDISEFTDFYNVRLLYLCPFLRKKKTNFRHLLLSLLKKSSSKCTMFLTDDSFFIKPIDWDNNREGWIESNPVQHQFSFRHGMELINCKDNAYLAFSSEDDIVWDFSKFKKDSHWGYNFSLDAHVYNTSFIYSFLKYVSFSNPNTLESSGMLHAGKKHMLSIGKCNKHISILSYPINIVQSTFKNEALNATPQILNEYYLNGYYMEYPKSDIISTFQVYPDVIYLVKDKDRISLNIK